VGTVSAVRCRLDYAMRKLHRGAMATHMFVFVLLALTVLVSGLITIVSSAGAASARSAVVGCHDTGCNGADPVAMGCADEDADPPQVNFVVTGAADYTGTIEVVYSPTCHAAWALLKGTTTPQFWDTRLQLWKIGPVGGPESLVTTAVIPLCTCDPPHGFTVFTTMIAWDGSLKACYNTSLEDQFSDPAPGGTE
jgi:Protein of unknown function (DUF2690)